MSQLFRLAIKIVKPLLSSTLYRPGSIVKILRGPCKGLRYRIFQDYGLSIIYGGWEPQLQQTFVKHVSAGDVVYDLGANYGVHTILLARLVGEQGHVCAFEPMPAIRASLVENLQLNSFQNVTVVDQAVSDRCKVQQFVVGHHEGAGHLKSGGRGQTSETSTRIDVKVTALDQFVAEGNRPPQLIKMDVEGSESAALRGAATVIARYRPVLVIELHTPEQDVLVGQFLIEHRYRAYRIETGEAVEDLTNGWPNPKGIWGLILAIPEPAIAQNAAA